MMGDSTVPGIPRIPASPDEITATWLTAALRPRWPDIEVRAVSAEPLGEGIGQMSVLKRLTLEHEGADDAPRHMVLKIHTLHAGMRAVAKRYRMFEREVAFYQRLASRLPVPTPKVYYSAADDSPACVLLMQDLSDWQSPDQLIGPTPGQTRLAVERLAVLTAAFWNADILQAESDWLPNADTDYLRAAVADYQACLPEFLRRFETRLPPGSAAAARTIAASLERILDHLASGPQTLIHYDYRVENMFFRADDPEAFCLLDWQLVMRGRPGWDFAYLVGTNLPVSLRRDFEADLRDLYLAGLQRAGVGDYSRPELDRDLAFATMAMTNIAVIGGANADLSNPRNEALFAAIGQRAFSAVLDGDCLSVLS